MRKLLQICNILHTNRGNKWYLIRPKSDHCVALSVTFSSCWFFSNWIFQSCYVDLSRLLDGFVKIDVWISLSCYMDLCCQKWYMDFSRLLDGFVKIDAWISLISYMDLSKLTWISQQFYMDSSKLLGWFVKVVTWIGQTYSMHLALYQTKPNWSLTKISKFV